MLIDYLPAIVERKGEANIHHRPYRVVDRSNSASIWAFVPYIHYSLLRSRRQMPSRDSQTPLSNQHSRCHLHKPKGVGIDASVGLVLSGGAERHTFRTNPRARTVRVNVHGSRLGLI
jgi:hypothetical protein